jgi:CRISPR/Cas system CSM-associated protein Csm3 (group 7 of RAMP superfamily)
MANENALYDRLVVRGEIYIPRALHIGSGEASHRTDAAIRRDADDQPYIPGSSLAGLLRATALDLAPYYVADADRFDKMLFGHVKQRGQASRIFVEDANITNPLPTEVEVRDHVGIDRRRAAARSNIQYDNEITPGKTRYRFEISIDEPLLEEIGILLAVLDLWGHIGFNLGGKTTTGLGEALVDIISLTYFAVQLSNQKALYDYLSNGDPKNPIEFLPGDWKITRAELDEQLRTFKVCRVPRLRQLYAEAFRPQHLFMTIDLIPEEPLLVQAPVAKLPAEASDVGKNRVSDADFVTTLAMPADAKGKLSETEYIPGSSLKGVIRSRAEKIARTLNFHRNGSDARKDEIYRTENTTYQERICACAVTHQKNEPGTAAEWPEPEKLLACFGTDEKQRGAQDEARRLKRANDSSFPQQLYEKSCITCRMFGNSMMRGRLHASDAELIENGVEAKLFDHVAIDRFHGGAADRMKFDTRPLMPQIESQPSSEEYRFKPMFRFRLHLERPEPWMIGLLAHLLKDLATADLRLGHATHRGYGRVRGRVTDAVLLILPGSELHALCRQTGLLPTDRRSRVQTGPFWQVTLELPQLFAPDLWTKQDFSEALRNSPTAKLLIACEEAFQEAVKNEESKDHGQF